MCTVYIYIFQENELVVIKEQHSTFSFIFDCVFLLGNNKKKSTGGPPEKLKKIGNIRERERGGKKGPRLFLEKLDECHPGGSDKTPC